MIWSPLCVCHRLRAFYSRWHLLCPPSYRWVKLAELATSDRSRLPLPYQVDKIQYLQVHPDLSYLFTGPAATSKTVYSIALLRAALNAWITSCPDSLEQERDEGDRIESPIWRINASLLLKQAHGEALDREDESGKPIHPVVDGNKIRRAAKDGAIPHLFLEEIDKLPTFSDFRTDFLFDLFNSIYEVGGQLVMSANKTSAQLKAMFGPINGEAFLRRVKQEDGRGQVWEFGKIPGLLPLK